MQEIIEKSETELRTLLTSLREDIQSLRFKIASRELKDVREVREKKKDLARVLMVLSKSKQA